MKHAIAAMEVAEAFEQARLVLGNLRTYSPLACAMDLIKDNLMFRTWLTLTDVLEEPEQAIPKRDALAILTENDLTTYLEHVPTMLLEW
jgi:hypothetical protein